MSTKDTSTITKDTTATKATRLSPTTPQQVLLRELSNHWKALTGPQKSGWQALARRTAAANGTSLSRTGALPTYLAVNSAYVTAGQSIAADAPVAPVQPAALPPLVMSAAFDPATGALSLILTASSYPNPVVVSATKPLLIGQDVFKNTPFKRLGALPGLHGITDLSAMYTAQFHVPGDGYQIVLRLTTVSPSGVRSAPVQHTILVGLVAAAGAAQGDDQGDDEGDLQLHKTA